MKKITDILAAVVILPIRLYQKTISKWTGAHCKYYPTCSAYAITAIKKHGILYGGALAVWRVLRCNPWSKGGIDYVPERKFWQRENKE